MKAINVEKLSFSYDKQNTILKQLSFHIEEGSYTTIIGHNGSGKSTIAKLLIGLLEKDEGSIYIQGIELKEETLQTIRSKIGVVFQNPDNQFIGATVADDIAFGLENHQVDPEKMEDIIQNFAHKVGMNQYLQQEPTKLSGGQKQRVAIAGVLAMTPSILIFDEATSMLDPKGKEEIKRLIKEIHQLHNITILSITHDMEEVAQSDHVIVLKQGRIVMEGKPADIFLNDQQLKDLQLDIPFQWKLKQELEKRGITLSNELTIEEVVDELCQLRLKK
ncbi:MAG: energy-coupling factor transporter ATPase [Erysipelotrichaceae bacterium]|nr:energy-coupling factor transporter ATPase [Erysipelotrichaceae bacterium]